MGASVPVLSGSFFLLGQAARTSGVVEAKEFILRDDDGKLQARLWRILSVHRILLSEASAPYLPPAPFSAFSTSASVDRMSQVSLSVAAPSASSDLTNS